MVWVEYMRIRSLYIALLLFFIIQAQAQYTYQWEKTFGNSGLVSANSLAIFPSGEIIIVGTLKNNGLHTWIKKISPQGQTLWTKFVENHQTAAPARVVVLPDSSFVIAGYTRNYEDPTDYLWLAKFDSTGTLLWERSFYNLGYAHAQDIRPTPDKGFIIAANIFSQQNPSDWLIVKTDSLGFIQWYHQSGTPYNDQANAIAVLNDNSYAIAGFVGLNKGYLKTMAVSIYDSTGYETGYREFKELGFSEAMALTASNDTSLIVAGYTVDSSYRNDIVVLKLNYYGDTLWKTQVKLPFREIPFSVIQAFDKTYIVAYNLLTSEFPYSDIGIIQLSPDGQVIFSSLVKQTGDEFVAQLIENKDNGISILATNHTMAQGWKISLTKCKSKLTTQLKFIIPHSALTATSHNKAVIKACITSYMKPKKLVILHNGQPVDTITRFDILQDKKCQFAFDAEFKLKFGINVFTFVLTDYKSYKIIRKRTIIYIPLPGKIW